MHWKDAIEVLHALEGCNGSIACNGKTAMEDDVPMKLNYMILMGFVLHWYMAHNYLRYTVNNYMPYTITMHYACIILYLQKFRQ